MQTYREWRVDFDMPPIPCRDFDWVATSPDYDVDCDEDGFGVCSGSIVHAATFEELTVEVDCAIADLEEVS